MTARTGGNVDAWCGKCNLLLAHTIEAMVGTTIKRVHCNTCMSQHMFRDHAPGEGGGAARSSRERSTPARAGRSSAAGVTRASDYENYLKGRDLSAARRYAPRETFAVGEVLEHPKFGLGVATALKDGGKFEALFADGPRVLVHGR